MKEGRLQGPWEYGMWVPANAGRRNDSVLVHEAITENPDITDMQLHRFHFTAMGRYAETVHHYRKLLLEERIMRVFIPNAGWQQRLFNELAGVIHQRRILWYQDVQGNQGKTHFGKYYNGRLSYYSTDGNESNILYSYDGQPVIFLDLPRNVRRKFSYEVLEKLKNGIFLVGKYRSRVSRYEIPHVVVFANWAPKLTALSQDRWDVRLI